MEHSTTTDRFFEHGIVLHDIGVTLEELIRAKPSWILAGKGLEYLATYDGYIRRKYGLVDDNGEEIFR
jgi:hypothetical protein